MHGVLATTMSVGPVLVVNGPVGGRIGMNSGLNSLGQGNRANSTIGRAVQLVVRNVGGGPERWTGPRSARRPRWASASPRDEAGSPWTSLAESRRWRADQSTVTVFAGESPRIFADERSRSPESLTKHLAQALQATVSPRMMLGMDAMLVLSPDHRPATPTRAGAGTGSWTSCPRSCCATETSFWPVSGRRRGPAPGGGGPEGPQVSPRRAAGGACRRTGRTVLGHHRRLGQRAERQ